MFFQSDRIGVAALRIISVGGSRVRFQAPKVLCDSKDVPMDSKGKIRRRKIANLGDPIPLGRLDRYSDTLIPNYRINKNGAFGCGHYERGYLLQSRRGLMVSYYVDGNTFTETGSDRYQCN